MASVFPALTRRKINPLWHALGLAGMLLLAPMVPAADDELTAEDMADLQNVQAEMADAMKQMQSELEKLDPATRAQVEGLMQQATSKRDEPPKRSATAIAKIDESPLSPSQLKAHVEKLQEQMRQALKGDTLKRANKVDANLQKLPDYNANLRATANGLAAMGAWPEAIYLTTKLSAATGAAQDLSNLAAFLVMEQAETAALPILHTLNARYPDNSTVLNNLGQAYYQLGDQKKAEKYLIAAVKRSPKHPQANLTRSVIQQANGDQTGAQESAHAALQGGYSESKSQQLRKSGGKLTRSDVEWKIPLPADPLGVKSAAPLLYPLNVDALPLLIAQKISSNQEAEAKAAQYRRKADAIPAPTTAESMSILHMPFYQRTSKLLQIDAENMPRQMQNLQEKRVQIMLNLAEQQKILTQKINALDAAGRKRYADVPGGYQFDYTCGEVKSSIQEFLTKTVPPIQENDMELWALTTRTNNDQLYLSQFVLPAKEFERAQWNAKAAFTRGAVGAPEALNVVSGYVEQRKNACWKQKPTKAKPFKLPDFNDIHCAYLTSLDIPGVGSMTFRCDTTEVTLNPDLAPFEVAWTSKYTGHGADMMLQKASAAISVEGVKIGGHSEFDEQGLKSGGVSVGVGVSVGPKVQSGPFEIGVGANVAGAIEFDRNGISDVSINAGLKGKASGTIAETNQGGKMASELSADVGSSWSWNAGANTSVSPDFDSSVLGL